MKAFLDKIREPEKGASLKIQMVTTIGIILFGFALGVLQKWIDGSPSNIFPLWLQWEKMQRKYKSISRIN